MFLAQFAVMLICLRAFAYEKNVVPDGLRDVNNLKAVNNFLGKFLQATAKYEKHGHWFLVLTGRPIVK
jgi:hypothetical protein